MGFHCKLSCLVGLTSEKYEFVNWDDEIAKMWKTTNQHLGCIVSYSHYTMKLESLVILPGNQGTSLGIHLGKHLEVS